MRTPHQRRSGAIVQVFRYRDCLIGFDAKVDLARSQKSCSWIKGSGIGKITHVWEGTDSEWGYVVSIFSP